MPPFLDTDKFAKVLALVESSHPGEALSALRAARIMLDRAGMNFRDLGRLLREDGPPPAPTPPPVEPAAAAHDAAVQEAQVRELQRLIERQQGELERQRQETERWRRLAQETANQLWDLGKALEQQGAPPTVAARRRLLLDHLRDPEVSCLSDREIAGRLGLPLAAVLYWRRRLRQDASKDRRVRRRARRQRLAALRTAAQ